MMTDSSSDLPKIGAPAVRALASVGVTRLEQLTNFKVAELLALHGFGPKEMRTLREALKEKRLSFNG